MSFEYVINHASSKFNEANTLLLHIQSLQPNEGQPTPNPTEKLLKGVFLVSLYAAIENSITIATETAISMISSKCTPYNKLKPGLLSICLASDIASISEARKKRLSKASELFQTIHSDGAPELKSNPISSLLTNIWYQSILEILSLLGAPPLTTEKNHELIINEITSRRNEIAHGRDSAIEIGGRYTVESLQIRYNTAREVVDLFIEKLKELYEQDLYMRQ